MQFRKRTAVFLIIFIGLLTYWGVSQNNFILGDDEDQILNHVQVRALSNIPRFFFGSTYFSLERNESYGLFYRPLMLTSYAALYAAFGPNPTLFHLFQLALHIGSVIIVFFLMSSFFPVVFSFLVALIFLVHPINSETVIHSANLQDTLFFFFGSLSLLTFISNKNKSLSRKNFILVSFFLLLSVFSKETGVLFGFVSLIYAILFSKKNIKPIALIVIGVVTILAIFRFGIAKIGFNMPIFSPIAHAPLSIRLLNMPSIFIQYLKTFLFPINLQTAQFWLEKEPTLFGFFIPLAGSMMFIIASTIAAVLISRKKKKLLPTYIFFTLWFILGMSIHLQIIPLEVTVALRWFYFPIIGLLGMIATMYYAFCFNNSILKKVGLIIGLIIVLLFATRTYIRVADWADSKTLFVRELQTSKGNYILENNLATLYIREGEYGKATPLVKKSLAQYQYFGNLNNMALLFAQQKNLTKAEEYFEQAMQKLSNYMVYQNYGNFLLFLKKDNQKAIKITSTGILKYPAGSSLFLIKAQAEYNLGNYEPALKDAKTGYTILPSDWAEEVYTAIKEKREIQVKKFFKLE